MKRKTKDDRPGKPPKWWFVIHDSEDALQALESNWDWIHVQTNWKLEPCYKPVESCLADGNSAILSAVPSALTSTEESDKEMPSPLDLTPAAPSPNWDQRDQVPLSQ